MLINNCDTAKISTGGHGQGQARKRDQDCNGVTTSSNGGISPFRRPNVLPTTQRDGGS